MKKILLAILILISVITFGQKLEKEPSLAEKINTGFKPIAEAWGSVVFYSFKIGGSTVSVKDVKTGEVKDIDIIVSAKNNKVKDNKTIEFDFDNSKSKDFELSKSALEVMEGRTAFVQISGSGEYQVTSSNNNVSVNVANKVISIKGLVEGGVEVPLVVVMLLLAGLIFTLLFKFINIRRFPTSVNIVRGKYDEIDHVTSGTMIGDVTPGGDSSETIRVEENDGEVSHFQALTAALSGTVGLGNIAGVAVALSLGGPGATFWMIIAGLFGMSAKFVECTLAVKYRDVGEDGKIFGGPMYYLKKGLADVGQSRLGKILAVFFAIMVVGGSFGGGNMFQANQAAQQFGSMVGQKNASLVKNDNGTYKFINLKDQVTDNLKVVVIDGKVDKPTNATELTLYNNTVTDKSYFYDGSSWNDVSIADNSTLFLVFGLVISILVAIVILGGISRIGQITEKVVPFMVGIYFLAALIILGANYSLIGDAFSQIISGAFSPEGITGGFVGVLIQGFKRAAFSNEAGVGSAAIAHSAVKTKYAASEGLVALLEPFIDTVVVCTMTALVIIITNVDGSIMNYGVKSPDGVLATSKAFASVIPWFPYILTLAVVLFAFSTMLSWSYYGLQGWLFLFGRSKAVQNTYKIIFCFFIIIGSVASLGSVTDFSDAMIFAMAVPNIIGLFFLFPKVRDELVIYLKAIKIIKP